MPLDCLTRRHFSSKDVGTLTYSNLGLVETLVHPHSDSIRQLPEIDKALQNWDDVCALDNLQRATQVFEMMQSGGSSHIAALSLLAECYQHQENYEKASRVLSALEKLVSESSETSFYVSLALSKASWYQGDFDRSMACVKQLMENNVVDDSSLNRGCVLNAEGLVRLMNSPLGAEDGSSVVSVLKIAPKITERDSRSSTRSILTSASARGNLGIAIVVTRLGLQDVRPFRHLIPWLCEFRTLTTSL
jgi:tetratricopeptide (TPR) repeat protein